MISGGLERARARCASVGGLNDESRTDTRRSVSITSYRIEHYRHEERRFKKGRDCSVHLVLNRLLLEHLSSRERQDLAEVATDRGIYKRCAPDPCDLVHPG